MFEFRVLLGNVIADDVELIDEEIKKATEYQHHVGVAHNMGVVM